jgi:ribonucleoside-diphosphate reductase alpha chain
MDTYLLPKAVDIINARYLHVFDGKRETIEEWVKRICTGITKEITDDEKRNKAQRMIADLLNSGRAIFNTPTMMNAGLPNGQLAACFALPISDDMGRSDDGIFATLRNAALIQQTGGGIGFDFSEIRPIGDAISTTSGTASGPVSFLEIYNKSFTGVQQGGCLIPETLVGTSNGLLRLDEIIADLNKPGWSQPIASLKVNTFDEFDYSITSVFNNGESEVIELTTSAGIKICGTPNHKVHASIAENKADVWKPLEQIRVGDEIIFKTGFYNSSAGPQFIHNVEIDNYFAFVIGYLSSHEIMINNGELIVETENYNAHAFIHAFTMLFNYPILNRGRVLVMQCPQCLDDVELFVNVPPQMRRTNTPILSYYIHGLLMDHENLQIKVRSEKFAQEISTIIIALGWMVNIFKIADAETNINLRSWVIELYKNNGDICEDHHITFNEFARSNPPLSSIIVVPIKSITKCIEKCLTLDLSVDNVHCYIANGISVHNSRRGANMGIMRVDHPDIKQFISCKNTNEKELTCFNLSVAITDKFMEAVNNGEQFDLINPHTHRVSRTVDARALMRKISTNAWKNGEPGVIFIDHVNSENAMLHKYKITTTNPCVPADTIVMTTLGPRTVAELIGRPFTATIDGKGAVCTRGFFTSGVKDIYCLKTNEGYCLKLTNNHCVLAQYKISGCVLRRMVSAQNLCVGDKIIMNNNCAMREWGEYNKQREALAYLVGYCCMNNIDDETIIFTSDNRETIVSKIITAGINDVYYEWDTDNPNKRYAISIMFARIFYTYFAHNVRGILTESSYFQTEFIRGALSCASCTPGEKLSVNYAFKFNSHVNRLDLIQHMLINLGIFTSIANNMLFIEFANINTFYDKIGSFGGIIRKNGCKEREFLATFKELIPCEEETEVFDCTVENLHMFSANSCKISNCGEIPLGPYENCCLGHVNLAKHVIYGEGGNDIDWILLEKSVRELTRALNMVIDANAYVPAIPQLRAAALDARRIGLGITGLADLFVMIGFTYGSDQSLLVAEHIISFIRVIALHESALLAKEFGPFPAFEGSLWSKDEWRTQFLAKLQTAVDNKLIAAETRDRGVEAIMLINQYGLRNSSVLTVAPTGTTSLILGTEGYGCEPIYSLSYTRTLGDGTKLKFCSDLAKKIIAQYASNDALNEIYTTIAETGHVPQNASQYPSFVNEALNATALNISPDKHIAMQSVLQKWVDNSISKTVNCPNSTTIEEIEQIYMQGWKLGLKGVAVYREGSRQIEVLQQTSKKALAQQPIDEKKRPMQLYGATYRCEANFGYVFTTINVMESITDSGKEMPFEVFVNVGKSGSDIHADSEAMGRLISMVLRMTSNVSIAKRMENIISQLRGIGGARGHRDSSTKVVIHSLPDAIALTLEEFMKDWSNKVTNAPALLSTTYKAYNKDICPECGHAAMIRVERCQKCENCGYAAC